MGGVRLALPSVAPPKPISLDAMNEDLRGLLAPRVDRLGYLGEFFQLAAHQPAALAAFIRFTEALKGALPWRLAETIALTIAAQTDNQYELIQHERLASRLGMSAGEISMLVAGRAATPTFATEEVIAAELAKRMVSTTGRDCEGLVAQLEREVESAVAVGCVLLCGRYLAHAAISNAWRLSPPPPARRPNEKRDG